MKRFRFPALFVVVSAAVVLALFSTGLIAPDTPTTVELDEFAASPEWAKVADIRQEGLDLISTALDYHGKEVLKAAFKAELAGTANGEAGRMVYGSQAAADAFMLRLNKATTTLMDRYPALADSGDSEADCSPTPQKIDAFFANFESIHSTGATAQTDCKWIQYTACLAACTTTGPIIYFACAYLCFCTFCDNDASEAICL